MSEKPISIKNPEAVLNEWLQRLNALVVDVKTWVERSGWRTRVIRKPIQDCTLGRYEAPVLLMEPDAVEVALNPVSRWVPGAEGAVDLYLVPAYDDIAGLYFENGRWGIHYDFPVPLTMSLPQVDPERHDLSETAINQVLDSIAAHA